MKKFRDSRTQEKNDQEDRSQCRFKNILNLGLPKRDKTVMAVCCKLLIKTDNPISLAVLNNISNEIRKARLRLHKVKDIVNMHFLTRRISYI
jgi:hypothetical protein